MFGTHKLRQHIIGGSAILSLIAREGVKKEDVTFIFELLITKFLFANLSLWFYAFEHEKSLYLVIFMFCMSIAMLTAIVYLFYFIFKIGELVKRIFKKDIQYKQ